MSANKDKEVDALEFDLDLQEFPVVLRLQGQPTKFTIREITGTERDAYLNTLAPRMQTSADGKTSRVKNFDGLQADLVSRCLFDEGGKNVPKAVIQKWPARVQNGIFTKCQSICGLDLNAQEQAKND